MAVTIGAINQIGTGVFRVSFSSDLGGTPTFYIWRDGEIVSVQNATEFVIYAVDGETVDLEIFDDASQLPRDAFPATAIIGFEVSADGDKFKIEQYIASVWTELVTLQPPNGVGWWEYRTSDLADVTTHQFRVTPIDQAGNEGTPRTFAVLMVRNPEAPNVTMSYSGGNVTIAAA